MCSMWNTVIFIGLTGIFQNALAISFHIDPEDIGEHIESHRTEIGKARLKRLVELRNPAKSAEMNERFKILEKENERKHSRVKRFVSGAHIRPNEGGMEEEAIEFEDEQSMALPGVAENGIETAGNENNNEFKDVDFDGLNLFARKKRSSNLIDQPSPLSVPSILAILRPGKITDTVRATPNLKRRKRTADSGPYAHLFSLRHKRNHGDTENKENNKHIKINHKNWRQHAHLLK